MLSGRLPNDTHLLRSLASDNTGRRGRAVGSTAVVSPADWPGHNLRAA